MLDWIITGGTVIDGTGKSGEIKDIGIKADTICELGDLSGLDSLARIDASGKIVCPGFVDAHSHSDAYLLIEPSSPSKISQGITTEVVGNCGASAAPLTGKYHMPSDWRDKEFPGTWSSVEEYKELLQAQSPGPNVVLLTGHNTLRVCVAGYEDRRLTSREMDEVKDLLRKSLDEGSHGMSTGLIYSPGMYAPREEIVELAKVVAEYDGIYTSHMRSESGELLEAVEEALSIGRESGVRVQISHLKASGRRNWKLLDKAIGLIRGAREDGIEVCADRYPYLAGATELDVVFPAWAAEGGRDAVMSRLKDEAQRERLRGDLMELGKEHDWSGITIGSTSHPDNKRFRGMCLIDVADELKMHPVDAILHVVELDELMTGAFFGSMSQENLERVLCEPYVMLGTDASLRATEGPLSMDYPHPRSYGSFPRFIRMVLDKKLMSLEEAVRKMTSLPAKQFRLERRGTIENNMKADIIIMDTGRVRDTASYAEPHSYSEGIEHVIVNGVHTVDNGVINGRRGGRFI